MTDFEITKLCAEAMGWDVYEINPGVWRIRVSDKQVMGLTDDFCSTLHDPLHDDAQAMALEDWLIERGNIAYRHYEHSMVLWFTPLNVAISGPGQEHEFKDKAGRRRAICECAAKMQKAKA